ncbi:MAG: DUF4249 domain-containing protein [Sphingobacteriaceae bacterium]|nr:MAG: DUF4249 domain-containing protein [Sphingobacteriaceae bacterium]
MGTSYLFLPSPYHLLIIISDFKDMRGYTRYIFLAVLAGMILYSCKKAYMPADVAENANLLVVEGVINAGGDSTIIKLSRTIKLTGGTGINAQAGAQVTVEEENGGSFSLQEKPNGLYVAAALNIDNTKKYRLRIKTGAKEYLSDFVEVKITPPIDKVDFNIKSNALDVNVNAHDDGGNTRYYRWAFDETWEFNANFFSPNKSNGEKVVPRDLVNDNIYHCWANNSSTSILLGSTAKLSPDHGCAKRQLHRSSDDRRRRAPLRVYPR